MTSLVNSSTNEKMGSVADRIRQLEKLNKPADIETPSIKHQLKSNGTNFAENLLLSKSNSKTRDSIGNNNVVLTSQNNAKKDNSLKANVGVLPKLTQSHEISHSTNRSSSVGVHTTTSISRGRKLRSRSKRVVSKSPTTPDHKEEDRDFESSCQQKNKIISQVDQYQVNNPKPKSSQTSKPLSVIPIDSQNSSNAQNYSDEVHSKSLRHDQEKIESSSTNTFGRHSRRNQTSTKDSLFNSFSQDTEQDESSRNKTLGRHSRREKHIVSSARRQRSLQKDDYKAKNDQKGEPSTLVGKGESQEDSTNNKTLVRHSRRDRLPENISDTSRTNPTTKSEYSKSGNKYSLDQHNSQLNLDPQSRQGRNLIQNEDTKALKKMRHALSDTSESKESPSAELTTFKNGRKHRNGSKYADDSISDNDLNDSFESIKKTVKLIDIPKTERSSESNHLMETSTSQNSFNSSNSQCNTNNIKFNNRHNDKHLQHDSIEDLLSISKSSNNMSSIENSKDITSSSSYNSSNKHEVQFSKDKELSYEFDEEFTKSQNLGLEEKPKSPRTSKHSNTNNPSFIVDSDVVLSMHLDNQNHFRKKLNLNGKKGKVGGADDDSASHSTTILYGGEADESVANGSVNNGSWTGLMRARQAAEAAAAERDMYKSSTESPKTPRYRRPVDKMDDNDPTKGMPSSNVMVPGKLISTPKSAHDDLNEGVNELKNIARNDPSMAAAVGVSAAAAAGVILMGPVGLLLGAASVGIAVGVMQIPEEQRTNVSKRAKSTIHRIHSSVQAANDIISHSCSLDCNTQNNDEGTFCFETNNQTLYEENNGTLQEEFFEGGAKNFMKESNFDSYKEDSHVKNFNNKKASGHHISPEQLLSSKVKGNKRIVCCRRKGKITPVSQIHSLSPSLQPRAWLDVMASIGTTPDEKSEAMEEILILCKDKNHARMFLEEGIIDSLMHIIRSYCNNSFIPLENLHISMDVTKLEKDVAFFHAKTASNCCIALGKAHCALVHTEGDLLLMSSYSHGSVPVSRQLAQMLYEVPHHEVINSNEVDKESFTLAELSLQQAEELSRSILYLAEI